MVRGLGALVGLALVCAAAAPAAASDARPPGAAAQRPNILMIVADDLGFSDLGVYGGEARTPNLDRLARDGALFSQYRTSPLCSPSRAMLLTGVDAHRTGVATIPEVLPPEHKGRPGYVLHLEPGVETLATRLQRAGYRTYLSGKWHLGDRPQDLPSAHGFGRSFALDASGADNWSHKSYMPYYASAPWFEDGKPVRYPDGRYSSTVIADRLLGWLDEDRASKAPFFAYVAFLAVHIPVQAPVELTETYARTYEDGWDALRERRLSRLKAAGLAPPDAVLPPPHPRFRRWDSLPEAERRLLARSMAVHAAMIEMMDREIGRILARLEATGERGNTIVVFTSDNGPEPSDPLSQTGYDLWMAANGYRRAIDGLGGPGSMNFIGPEWANATATPGALFKFYTTDGGVRVPLLVAGPGVKAGLRADGNAFATDLAPTLLELAGGAPAGPGARSIDGRSQAPVLSGATAAVREPGDAIGIEVSGNAALIDGGLKLVRNAGAWADGAWRLFDITSDPGETRDLSQERPEDLARLKAAYAAFAARVGVLEMPPGYDIQRQVAVNALGKQLETYGPRLLALVAAGLLLVALIIRLLRRRRSARPA